VRVPHHVVNDGEAADSAHTSKPILR
jgi:hypothetical protein